MYMTCVLNYLLIKLIWGVHWFIVLCNLITIYHYWTVFTSFNRFFFKLCGHNISSVYGIRRSVWLFVDNNYSLSILRATIIFNLYANTYNLLAQEIQNCSKYFLSIVNGANWLQHVTKMKQPEYIQQIAFIILSIT